MESTKEKFANKNLNCPSLRHKSLTIVTKLWFSCIYYIYL